MKLIARGGVLFLAVLAGCKGELASVTVNLAADGSGDCSVVGVRDVNVLADEKANPGGVIEGGADVKSMDIHLRHTRLKFASIGNLKIGEITFTQESKDGANLLTVRIPTGTAAKWYREFGVSEPALATWTRVEQETKKEDEARRKTDPNATRSSFDPPKPPNVSFDIHLPAKLAGHAFETVPLGMTTKVAIDKGERSVSLSIPLSEIHAGKLREIVWKISY